MNESKQIDVNSASIVDLKAELYRKQESFRLKKLSQSQQQVVENDTNLYEISCNQIKYKLGKRIREKGDKELIANYKRKNDSKQNEDKETKREEDIEVEKALQRSREMLEKKSKLYDKLSRNPNLMNNSEDLEEEMDERILVDFHQKASDKRHEKDFLNTKTEEINYSIKEDEERDEDEEEWTEFVDSLGRSRKCLKKDLQSFLDIDRQTFGPKKTENISKSLNSSDLSSVPHLSANNELLSDDLRRELQRRDWETNSRNEVIDERESQLKSNLNIHYQNIQNNEIRDHGVAYYSFAEDQTQRQEQMDLLKELRDQTVTRKEQKQKLKQKRKQLLRQRLAKVAQRKGIPFQPKESSSESEEDSDVELAVPEPKPTPSRVRDWDVGKPDLHEVLSELRPKPVMASHKTYVEDRRSERLSEFAPPSAYNQNQWKNNFRDKRSFNTEKSQFVDNSKTHSNTGNDFNDYKPNHNKSSDYIDSNEGKEDVNQTITNALSYFRNNLKQ